MSSESRTCLRDPIPQIFEAARFLDAAVTAHLEGKPALADELIRRADMPAIREWTESLWGKGGPWTRPLPVEKPNAIPSEGSAHKKPDARQGGSRRFDRARRLSLPWAPGNANEHAGFQALWLTYDHLLPHARGGTSELENMLVTCQSCNCGCIHSQDGN